MTIRFSCPECSKSLKADEQHSGRKVRCDACGTVVVVPPSKKSSAAEPKPAADDQPDEEISTRSQAQRDDEIDMTPMVDVVFQLLIFFMVTAAFSKQKSIQVPPPDPTQGVSQNVVLDEPEEKDDIITARIEQDGTVWINDELAPSEQAVISRIKQAREGGPGATTQGPGDLKIIAHPEGHHEVTVMVIDAGNAAGVNKIQLQIGDDEE